MIVNDDGFTFESADQFIIPSDLSEKFKDSEGRIHLNIFIKAISSRGSSDFVEVHQLQWTKK